ncbi:MAG TPA: PVC-type heme-binding CxxCH protein [Planctomycetota bacterium]|nr:PVC-type heme-binding CxxCH protein [Planctomycetota bacterium]
MSSRVLLLICFILAFSFGGLRAFAADEPQLANNLPPQEAAKAMTLPAGFSATLFAGEPDVVQPVAFTFDDRGRMWVCEILSYPTWKEQGNDRISIYEDTDGDGRFDTKKVFWDKGNYLTGIELGFGGVWVCSAPHFYFIPDRNGDDVPDGEPVALLDGWSAKGIHNVLNTLTWGPDGWLYGCNGITAPSNVGKPGTPDGQRIAISCGVWRYHPTRHTFEVVAHGTTNPFGMDFDDFGQMFITNCVIGHLWHVIPGAHYRRMFGQPAQHAYGLIEQCADHLHWAGSQWTLSRGGKGKHGEAGGGHSHVGAMVYLGDNWPDTYRHTLFTCNLHGNRVNNDILQPKGSGYVATHGKDFMFANDSWFRGLTIKYGPDGGVYVSDWHDTGECHNYKVVDRTNGRIFKITYGKPQPQKFDLQKAPDDELVRLHLHKNDWFVRHARRILAERAVAGTLKPETKAALLKILNEHAEAPRRLRALWTLHGLGIGEETLLKQLHSSEPYMRAWSIQLLCESRKPSGAVLTQFASLAEKDPSPVVRVHLASALTRLAPEQRWDILSQLVKHGEDVADQNLPLMYWFALEPLVPLDSSRALRLAASGKIPLLMQYTARRMGSDGVPLMVDLLLQNSPEDLQLAVLRGMTETLKGRTNIAAPKTWADFSARAEKSKNNEIRALARSLSAAFGDTRSIDALRTVMMDANSPANTRGEALDALLNAKAPDLVSSLQKLLTDPAMRGRAISALGSFDDAATPKLILEIYPKLDINEKRDALSTLAARFEYAKVLLEALQKKTVPVSDLNAFIVRQLEGLTYSDMNDWLKANWGTTRQTAEDKLKEIADYKAIIAAAKPGDADNARGRVVFKRTCGQCHKLFDDGGSIGPDLTGSGRADLDYLLQNMVDPNAITPRDYLIWLVKTNDGRVISGIVGAQDEQIVTIKTQTENIVLQRSVIKSMKQTELSMMPEGLLTGMSRQDLIDLISYLRSPNQVPLPAGK